MKRLVLAISLLTAAPVLAQEFGTIEAPIDSIELQGKTFSKVRITKKNDFEANVIHDSGMFKMPIAELPDEVQSALGFDPEAAERAREKREAVDAQRQVDAGLAARERRILKDLEANAENFPVMIRDVEDGYVAAQRQEVTVYIGGATASKRGGPRRHADNDYRGTSITIAIKGLPAKLAFDGKIFWLRLSKLPDATQHHSSRLETYQFLELLDPTDLPRNTP